MTDLVDAEGVEREELSEDEAAIAELVLECTRLDCMPENLDGYASPKSKRKALEQRIKNAEKRMAKAGKGDMQEVESDDG